MARTLAGLENGGVLDSKDTGVYRIDGGLLSQTLAEGVGLEEALKEKGDRFNSRGVWFQGAYPIRSGWNGRMEAEMVARSTVCAACWKPESALWTPAIAMWVPG